MREQRKNYTAEEKLSILKRHLVEKVPVSDLCDELGLNPNVFYAWQKQLFENGAAAFQQPRQAAGRSTRPKHRETGSEADPEERSAGRTDAGARRVKKSTWGALKGRWVPHDLRDEVVDFTNRWSGKTGIAIRVLVLWLGVSLSKFYDWRTRYGKVNEHNAQVPRDHWLGRWEKQAIVAYEREHPLEGYRRLTFMMLDDDVTAVSPPTVYRVLKAAGPARPALATQ